MRAKEIFRRLSLKAFFALPSSTFARLQDENNKSINFSWKQRQKSFTWVMRLGRCMWRCLKRDFCFSTTLCFIKASRISCVLLPASPLCFPPTAWKGWVRDILRSNLQKKRHCVKKKRNSHLHDIDLRRGGTKGNKIITKLCINFLQTHRFDMSAWMMPFISHSLSTPPSDLMFSYGYGLILYSFSEHADDDVTFSWTFIL